jgi:hypothetical protein
MKIYSRPKFILPRYYDQHTGICFKLIIVFYGFAFHNQLLMSYNLSEHSPAIPSQLMMM